MTADDTHTRPGRGVDALADDDGQAPPTLMIAWLSSEPARVGEMARIPPGSGPFVFGRGEARPDDPGVRVTFTKRGRDPHPITDPTISRVQLLIHRVGGELRVERQGKARLVFADSEVENKTLRPGDVIVVGDDLALVCVRASAGPLRPPQFQFGEPDEHGLVGESERAWSLRDELTFYAKRADAHVLIVGPSGAGKELCARAIHDMSPRGAGPFIARSAATLPGGIIDAELFGNAKNFPNTGMRERAGLIGEADGGTLFLDELGELPEAQQAHLLRVLDAGEYHRLGEDRARRADLRLVGATNRSPETLKHDLLARFKLRLTIPGLSERVEDIPILCRHVLRTVARRDAELAARFFDAGEARVDATLIAALVAHDFTTHVRELEALLFAAMATSRGERIRLTPAVLERLRRRPEPAEVEPSSHAEAERERIERALEAASGNVSVAWKIMGLSSRDALNRLIKKHGIVIRRA